jgi:hypothetical protein
MTDREFVIQHWPNTVAFLLSEKAYVIALDPQGDSIAWDVYDFVAKDENAAWANAANYTRILLKKVAEIEEEIAKCVRIRRQSDEPDRKIFTRITKRLRNELTKAVGGMKVSEG